MIGNLEGPELERLRNHLRDNCAFCIDQLKEAVEFWYVFAALTEKTQLSKTVGPSPRLRQRVVDITRTTRVYKPIPRSWMRIAAGILVSAGAATLSWNFASYHNKKDLAATAAQVEQQKAAVKKLESENTSLRNLVVAAHNAPAAFPGRESIVSVQDPYLLHDLQLARQTQAAAAAALNEERARGVELEKKLAVTTTLLASTTRDREEADQRYRKAYDAALENERGASRLSTELAVYNTRIQALAAQIGTYRGVIESQNKKIDQNGQLLSLLDSHKLAVLQLHGAGSDQTASGIALIGDDSRLAVLPSSLPAPAPGRIYQLWLLRDKSAPVSAGTFNGAPQFFGKFPMTGVKSVIITDEPAGGSHEPTGRKIITGSVTRG